MFAHTLSPFFFHYSHDNDHSQERNQKIQCNHGGENMIVYEPFWNTLKASGEATYTLIVKHHLSSSTIDKLRKNKPLNTTTINDLCRILDCTVEQIMQYVPSNTDQIL